MIKNKLSPKRPEATNPQRSEQAKEEWRQRGVRDAEDAMHISGDYSESPSSDDEDYMAGWNDTIQEGTNEIKITKSQLAQLVQEELQATLNEYGYDEEVDPEEAGQNEGIQEYIYDQIADNLDNGPLDRDDIFALTEPGYESPHEHLVDQWEEILDAALHEMSEADERSDYRIEKSHDTMTGVPYYSPIGFLG